MNPRGSVSPRKQNLQRVAGPQMTELEFEASWRRRLAVGASKEIRERRRVLLEQNRSSGPVARMSFSPPTWNHRELPSPIESSIYSGDQQSRGWQSPCPNQ